MSTASTDQVVSLNESVKKVLILGASGFLGGRLAEKLYLDHGHAARCLFRDYSRLARLARFPVEMVHGDIVEPWEYESAISDCDVYVFCVHGKDKNSKSNWGVNCGGLQNVLDQAVRNGARHFIYMSTTAIYEEQLEAGIVDETTEIRRPTSEYARGKWEGERLCRATQQLHGLAVTILRPTLIYGPFAPSWTIYPAELIRSGALKDFGGFTGTANPVFVDDVVDAIITCMLNEHAYGQAFVVNGNEQMRWSEYFDAFSQAIRGVPLEKGTLGEYWLKALPRRVLKEILKAVVRTMPRLAKKVYGLIRSHGRGDWSWAQGTDVSSIRLAFYRKKLSYRNQKLKLVVGFEPQYSFNQGMAMTAAWLRHHRFAVS